MSNYIFLFDLDSTITGQEILPAVAKEVGVYDQLRDLAENTLKGEIPYKQSFLQRINLLKSIPVIDIQELIGRIELNTKLVQFIQDNKARCYIVTGCLDVWIEKLIHKLGMEKNLFCSKAVLEGDYVQDVFSIIDKNAVISQMILPFVAVGNGNNDAEMIDAAEVGIGYGGVRPIGFSVMECASHIVYQEEKLVGFLNKLL